LLLAIATIMAIWKIALPRKSSKQPRVITYAEFMSEVEHRKISSAKFSKSNEMGEIEGTLREPDDDFVTSIPKESMVSVAKQLQQQGVAVRVRGPGWFEVTLKLFPLVVILLLWVRLLKVIRVEPRESESVSPRGFENRPIG
jgi:ATP-dependent Zn protease